MHIACMKLNPNHLIGVGGMYEGLGNIVHNVSINVGVPANMHGANPFSAPWPRHTNRVVMLFINH